MGYTDGLVCLRRRLNFLMSPSVFGVYFYGVAVALQQRDRCFRRCLETPMSPVFRAVSRVAFIPRKALLSCELPLGPNVRTSSSLYQLGPVVAGGFVLQNGTIS